MGRKRFTAEQIINMLREAEVLLNQDSTVGQVRDKGVLTLQVFDKWGQIRAR